MFAGRIEGIGPRYCPSIEDKIERFSDKDSHQLFVEPEGWNTIEYYVNGFASSLPDHVQYKALKKIPGFENAHIFRPGYAIEYDYFPPVQLKYTLETRLIENLYFAGQINGTTGYEEAGAQGIISGINAHLKLHEKDPFILRRSDAYIGVLIDDLITKGVDEPYRMFTSRAEHRILLRQGNADIRLTPKAYELGLASEERYSQVITKIKSTERILYFLKKQSVAPDQINSLLESSGTDLIKQKQKLNSILLRPQIHIGDLIKNVPDFSNSLTYNELDNEEILTETENQVKYERYITKEREMAEKLERLEDIILKEDFNYQKLLSLSFEAREKLSKLRPGTLGQASRISGVSPADISVLIVHLGR